MHTKCWCRIYRIGDAAPIITESEEEKMLQWVKKTGLVRFDPSAREKTTRVKQLSGSEREI